MSTVRFNTKENPFFDTLRKRVDAYFEQNKLSYTGNWRIYVKTVILITLAVANYIGLVFFTPAPWLALIMAATLGLLFAAIGFNVMHDGAHGAFSDKKWINNVMGYSLNLLGGDVQLWKIKHNMVHHSFTNIEGLDEDLDIQPFMRTNENQKWYSIHRFQHLYFGLLYGLTYLSWVFYDDFHKYFTGRVGGTKFRKFKPHQHIIFWAGKLLYFTLLIFIPMYTIGVLPAIIGFLVLTLTCGVVLALVFQLAHVVEETSFSNAYAEGTNVEDEWAVHQIRSTANFAMKSRIVSWFTGGLNYQVEHHLFPRISHVYYPEISKLVRETCDQFGIRYNYHRTMYSAVRSHVLHLRRMGQAA